MGYLLYALTVVVGLTVVAIGILFVASVSRSRAAMLRAGKPADEKIPRFDLSAEEAQLFCALESNLNFVLPAYVSGLNRPYQKDAA